MAWAKIDDGWWAHPKVMGLSLSASGLWARALSWSCHQRRDTVPPRFLAMVGADQEHADELVEAGLWHPCDDGWAIHDWADYQDKTLSEKRAEAGRKGAAKRWGTPADVATDGNPDLPSEANAMAGTHPGPSQPDPTREPSPSPDGDRDEPDEIEQRFNEHFWPTYPARNGKKPAKGKALTQFRKLTIDQQRRAVIGARNLARSDTLPKDAHRFLRRDTSGEFPFDDWQTPAESARASPAPGSEHDDFTAGWGGRIAAEAG